MAKRIVDKDKLTCDNRKCKKEVEEVYRYSTYHQLAVRDKITDKEFCKECFYEKESRYGMV